MDREIVVRGVGEVRALPDRASVRVTIEGDGAERDGAYTAAAELAGAVDQVLADAGAAVGRVVTAALVVQPTTRWKKGETVRTGWSASRTSIVEVLDLDELGGLLARLTGAGAALHGPSWELDADHTGHAEARRRAAADARSRAAAYAEALGVAVGPVAWVAEPGLRLPGPDGGGRFETLAVAEMAASGGGTEETIDVAPQEMAITASVEVGFLISAGPDDRAEPRDPSQR